LPDFRALLPLLSLVAACKPPPDERQHMPQADPANGLKAIERVGCGACHAIPALYWPKGALGPSLEDYGDQGMIAGRLPNRPDLLARFVREAPTLIPGTTMPAMPLNEEESRDVAAYLYSLRSR
jgi:cytochrome c1